MIKDDVADANVALLAGCVARTDGSAWQQGMSFLNGARVGMIPQSTAEEQANIMAEFNAEASAFGVAPQLDEPGLEANLDSTFDNFVSEPNVGVGIGIEGLEMKDVDPELVVDEVVNYGPDEIEPVVTAGSSLSHTDVAVCDELVQNMSPITGMWYHLLVGLVHHPGGTVEVEGNKAFLKTVYGSALSQGVSEQYLVSFRNSRPQPVVTQAPQQANTDGSDDSDGDWMSTESKATDRTSDHYGNAPVAEHFNIATLSDAPQDDPTEPLPEDVLQEHIAQEGVEPPAPDTLVEDIKSGHFDMVMRGKAKSRPEIEAAAERKKNPGIRPSKTAPKRKQHKEQRSDRGSTVVSLSNTSAQAEDDVRKQIESLNARVSGLEVRMREVETKVDGLQDSVNTVTAEQRVMKAEQRGMLELLMKVAQAVGAVPQRSSQADSVQQEVVESDPDVDLSDMFNFAPLPGTPKAEETKMKKWRPKDTPPATPDPPPRKLVPTVSQPKPAPTAAPVVAKQEVKNPRRGRVIRFGFTVNHFAAPYSRIEVDPVAYPNLTNPNIISKDSALKWYKAICRERYNNANESFRKNFLHEHNCSEIRLVLRLMEKHLEKEQKASGSGSAAQ